MTDPPCRLRAALGRALREIHEDGPRRPRIQAWSVEDAIYRHEAACLICRPELTS